MMNQAHRPGAERPILVPGRNCWTADAPVRTAGLLIDGREYYRAFYRAARQARHDLLLAGWRFNSDVRLLRGADATEAGEEVRLLPFLNRLCDENPSLRVYVLAWDFSFHYSLEWELSQEKLFRRQDGRLQFRYDAHHAVAGSHHQKFVVVDGQAAFVGGLDFSCDDWDDRDHRPYHRDRCDSGKEPHEPYHDVVAYLAGPAAEELAVYFRQRWGTATGETLRLATSRSEGHAPVETTVPLAARQVALSRNEAKTLTDGNSSLQIRRLYEDAIDAAEELIYLENQYFSSRAVFEALLDRMRQPNRPRLEIVLVLPRRLHSWVESAVMDAPMVRMVDSLREAARETGHRVGIYYVATGSHEGKEVPLVLHSKLLIVDDRFLTVGSANASNRSMGLDSELNVAFEASAAEPELAESIRAARANLLAEHGGLLGDPCVRRQLARSRGLVEALDRLADAGTHRLRHLTSEVILNDRAWTLYLESLNYFFDPERPVIEETVHEFLPIGNAGRA